MKRFLWAVACALAVVIFVPAARASHPAPPSFNPQTRWLQSCNDQESTPGNCVTDSMQCAWGDEDDVADVAYGKLSAGQSITDTLCIVTDPCSDYACPHMVVWDTTGAVTATVRASTGTWAGAEGCFSDPLWPQFDASALPTIPGTNGGYGLLTYYTITVTARKTTQMSAGFEVAQNDADGRFGYWHTLSNVPCAWR